MHDQTASRTELDKSGRKPSRRGILGSPWLPIVAIGVILLLLPPTAQAFDQPFVIRVLIRVVIFAIAAVSLNLLMGFCGLISVMHACIFGLGGYVVAILTTHSAETILTWPITIRGTHELAILLPLAVCVAAITSTVFGIVALRTTGAYFIMITLALNQMVFYFFVSLDQYGSEEGLPLLTTLNFAGYPATNRNMICYACIGFLLLILVLAQRLVDSRFGTVLRATNDNPARVAALGISPFPYRLTALVISGAIAGLAGVLFVVSQQFISPSDLSWTRSGDLIVMVVLGGMTTVWGPVIGAAALVLLELILSDLTIHWQLPLGLALIGLITFLPGGFSGGRKLIKASGVR